MQIRKENETGHLKICEIQILLFLMIFGELHLCTAFTMLGNIPIEKLCVLDNFSIKMWRSTYLTESDFFCTDHPDTLYMLTEKALTTDMGDEKFKMNYYFENQFSFLTDHQQWWALIISCEICKCGHLFNGVIPTLIPVHNIYNIFMYGKLTCHVGLNLTCRTNFRN